MRKLLWVAVLVTSLAAFAWADPGGEPGPGTDDQARRLYQHGVEYSRRQQWDQAIQAYLQAVRLDPRFVEAWTNLGYAYRKVRDYSRSVEAYRRALSLRPDFAPAHDYLARTYLAMGERQKALEHYEILRRLDPRMAERLFRAIQANDPDLGSSED